MPVLACVASKMCQFRANSTPEATDSDPRLQPLLAWAASYGWQARPAKAARRSPPRAKEGQCGLKENEGQALPLHDVYTPRSISFPSQIYTGQTSNLGQRLRDHNAGKVLYTVKFRPWSIRTATAFSHKTRAISFERHLKSGSGAADLP